MQPSDLLESQWLIPVTNGQAAAVNVEACDVLHDARLDEIDGALGGIQDGGEAGVRGGRDEHRPRTESGLGEQPLDDQSPFSHERAMRP